MKKYFVVFTCLFVLLLSPALAKQSYNLTLGEAYIKYNQIGWQNYEFYVITDLENKDGLTYEWTFDNKSSFSSEKVRYFFAKGEHTIKLKVEDNYGNVRYDTVRLNIQFWSLKNNWFWWVAYLIVVMLIIYYWAAKIMYLLNRPKISKEARYFLDLLDEHGWIDEIIKHHAKK